VRSTAFVPAAIGISILPFFRQPLHNGDQPRTNVDKQTEGAMGYTLEQLSADIRQTLKADSGVTGKQSVCKLVSKALLDREFIAQHLTPEQCRPRKVLYEDPDLGFCVCGHVYETAAHAGPHDHGSSWAIYGVAVGDTEMTDWRVVKKGEGDEPSLVEPIKTYVMKPGDSHLYDVGVIHSPKRDGLTKLVRVEGSNLDHVKRSKIKAA
jgi:hypothetical protein